MLKSPLCQLVCKLSGEMMPANTNPLNNNNHHNINAHNHTHKKVDQASLNQIFANASNNNNSLSLASLLQDQGYSTDISHVSIHMKENNKFDFSNCKFTDVTFSGDFHNKTFVNSTFQDSHFTKANFANSTFKKATFDHCDFTDSSFIKSTYGFSKINKGIFWGSDFSDSSFYANKIKDTIFTKSNFENTVDILNKIHDVHFIFNQKASSEYSFNNAYFHEVTPKIAISQDTTWYSTPVAVINEYNYSPISIPDFDHRVDDYLLAKEVKTAIDSINTQGLNGISIAQHVVHSDQPIIKKIKDYAYSIMEKTDALWIPGGPDLHPEFYGEENISSYPPFSYYREILEFSLTDAAVALQKPILGICHGSQLVNVFLGGSLHQNVDGNSGISPDLDILTYKGPIGSALDKNGSVLAPSYHHQAVNRVADSLEVVAKYKDVIKATQSKDGTPIMLTQYHPEHKADQNSINILDRFSDFSLNNALKKVTLKIADVLHIDSSFLNEASHSTNSHHLVAAPILPAVLPEMSPEVVVLA
ncbi:MAG: gamma-glutamyl-gamma-aminobutyrate hydrolase family protein [Proteobacteria bacterium]|nr:gamma-glutamyl-gamma-aminobutyrate hydrolase family protein [Pseudomonadota bacterium]